jgi:hypothetical protein
MPATHSPQTEVGSDLPSKFRALLGALKRVGRRVRAAIAHGWDHVRMDRRAINLVGLIATLGAPAWMFITLERPLRYRPIAYDESYFVWTGWSALQGLAPYKDFFEYKPPLLMLSHAAALAIFPLEGAAYRLFFTLIALAGVVSVHAAFLSRGLDRWLSIPLMVLVAHFFTHSGLHDASLLDAESIGLSYYLLGLACLIGRWRLRKTFDVAGGFFFTLSVLSKEPYGPPVILTWITCFLFVEGVRPGWPSQALRYLKYTVLGIAVAVVPLLVYMVPSGAFSHYVALVKSYATYSDPATSVCVVLGRWTVQPDLASHFGKAWDQLNKDFINLANLGVMLPFLGAGMLLARRTWLLLAATVATACAGIYSVTATGCYWSHYYVMAFSGLFCALLVGGVELSRVLSTAPSALRFWVRSASVLLILPSVYPRLETALASPTANPPTPPVDARLLEMVATHSTPHDRIFTTAEPAIYVWANRRSASHVSAILDDYLPQYPGTSDAEKLAPLVAELEQNRPKLVIFDQFVRARKVRHIEVAIKPFLKRHGYREIAHEVFLRPD